MPNEMTDTILPPPPPPAVPLEQVEEIRDLMRTLRKEMVGTNVRHRFKMRVYERWCQDAKLIEDKLNELCG